MSSYLLQNLYLKYYSNKKMSLNLARNANQKICSFLHKPESALKQQPYYRKQPFRLIRVQVFDKQKIISFLMHIKSFSRKYPLSRGMAVYMVIWPTSNLIHQTIIGRSELNFVEALRFCLYGSCFVAPTLHAWLSLATYIWPQKNIRAALTKAIVEQFTYTPFAMVSFFFIMSLMEGKNVHDAAEEVQLKFLPTYQVGALIWPIVQTINHTLIPERNKVPFVGFCSLLWTCFLAYMKQLEAERLRALKAQHKAKKELNSEIMNHG